MSKSSTRLKMHGGGHVELQERSFLKLTESGKVLGTGEYGVVCRGIFNDQPVAVKTVKGAVNVEEFKAVLAEV